MSMIQKISGLVMPSPAARQRATEKKQERQAIKDFGAKDLPPKVSKVLEAMHQTYQKNNGKQGSQSRDQFILLAFQATDRRPLY